MSWHATQLPAALVAGALAGARLDRVRAAVEALAWTRPGRIDRASYDVAPAEDAALHGVLAAAAREVTGVLLEVVTARALRFRPGDYALTRDDVVHEGRPVEVVLDLSPSAVEGAEVHWRHRGQVFFTMPCAPGTLAVVERGPTVLANHTYVSKRQPGARVVRLVALLRAAAGEPAKPIA